MKPRYVKRSLIKNYTDDLWYDPPLIPHLTVDESACGPRYTGLLDKDGRELMVIEFPETIGFLNFDK